MSDPHPRPALAGLLRQGGVRPAPTPLPMAPHAQVAKSWPRKRNTPRNPQGVTSPVEDPGQGGLWGLGFPPGGSERALWGLGRSPALPRSSPAHLAALGEDHRLGLAHSRQLINATRAHGTSPFSAAAEARRSEAHGIISATSQARTKAPCAQPQLVRAGRATRCKRKTLRPALGVSSPTRLP